MNILLANMPIEFNARENLEPPLGICYLAAMLKDIGGVNVNLKDYEISRYSLEILREELSRLHINVLGVSFRTASYRSAKKFIRAAKSINKDIFIVAGGHHASAFPKETLIDLSCDAVVMGEGEYIFKDIVERLMRHKPLAGLEGIAYRDRDSSAIVNRRREPIEDIDILPLPARDLLDLDQYNVITLLTSRGCPFNCVYCDKGISTRNVKFRSAESIFHEIKYIVERLHKRRLYIVDDHFFLNRVRLERLLGRIVGDRLPVKWVCQARVDGVTEDMLLKAKKAGCEQIMYGIETGDETELRYMRKNATLDEAETAVLMTKKAGITARANFMLGFPISTRETIFNTVRFAKKMKSDIVRFFTVSPLPNTDLWDDVYGKGCIPENMRWEDIDFYRPSFNIKDIPREEVPFYVTAAYWHVLKGDFLKEVTIYFIPNIIKLALLIFKTRKIRGNISSAFPKSINLILDNMRQFKGKDLKGVVYILKKAYKLEKTI